MLKGFLFGYARLHTLCLGVAIGLLIFAGAAEAARLPVSSSKNIVSMLKENPIVGKLVRGAGYGVLTLAFCVNMMSCGLHAPYAGDKIYFLRDGLAYGGVVKKQLDDGTYLVKVNGTNQTTTISRSEIGGEYEPSREERLLEGSAVVVAGDRDGIKYRNGVLKRYYNDGYVEIRITHETMHNDNIVELHEPYTIFADEDAPLPKGGFVIGDFY